MTALAIVTGASKGLGRAVSFLSLLSFLLSLFCFFSSLLFSFLAIFLLCILFLFKCHIELAKIAIEAAKSLSLSQLVLVSRSKEGMEDTKKQIHSSHPSLHTSIHSIDFSDLDHLENNVKSLFKEVYTSNLLSSSLLYFSLLISSRTHLLATIESSPSISSAFSPLPSSLSPCFSLQ